jgi:adenylate cyclase
MLPADRILKAAWFGLLVALLGAVAGTVPGVLRLEETIGLGALFQLRGPRPAPADVVVVSLDKESSDALGLPNEPRKWPRAMHAALVDRLAADGAAVIAFDMLFDEPYSETDDARLGEAITRAGNVVLTAFLRKSAVAVAPDGRVLMTAEQVVPPLAAIAAGAVAVVPFALPVVPVRVSQFWTFKASAGDVPTLPSATFQAWMLRQDATGYADLRRVCPDVARQMPEQPQDLLASQRVASLLGLARDCLLDDAQRLRGRWRQAGGDMSIARRSLLELYAGSDTRYLNFYGPPRSVTTVPYVQALGGRAGALAGRIVLVGFSERFQPEQQDSFHSVFTDEAGLNISGVEIAATAVANMLDGTSVRPLGIGSQLLVIAVWGLLSGALCRWLQPVGAVAFCIAAVPLLLGWSWWVFASTDVWLPLFMPLAVQLPAALVLGLLAQYRQARYQRERVMQALGSYLPRPAVDRLMENLGTLEANAELLYGTCLATDGENYTHLAETLSPDELAKLMNGYYSTMFAAVERNGGVVTDVVGDSMMALWAAATPDSATRARACAGALAVAGAVARWNATPGQPTLPTRVGLHTGPVRLGNIGGAGHVEFRAIGDIVNTASRIDGLNKRLGTRILVSAETLAGVEDLLTREVGTFLLAGKSQPLVVHELLGTATETTGEGRQRLARFGAALAAFRAGRWQEAGEAFAGLQGEWPGDGPAGFYADLCSRYLDSGPASFVDGAVRLTEK